MMGDNRVSKITKNIGAGVVALTIGIVVVYTVLDLPIITIEGSRAVWLRFFGVCIVSVVSYIPYFVCTFILQRTHYIGFFYSIFGILFIGDIFIRIDIIFSFLPVQGFLSLIIYSIIFTCIMGTLFLIEKVAHRCKDNVRNFVCNIYKLIIRKKFMTVIMQCKNLQERK